MATLEERIKAFSKLGRILAGKTESQACDETSLLASLINHSEVYNPWFTPDNVKLAAESIGESLSEENLRLWLKGYPPFESCKNPANVGIIMAGNIPFVGFHDLLCVLITGNNAIIKLSSKDEALMNALIKTIIKTEPEFEKHITLLNGKLTDFDAVIATGSDNSSRYFEYYFRNYPSIIRHNRNSVAFIEGNETAEELSALGNDIFSYFGLGCRNVSKLYLPSGYDINKFNEYWKEYEKLRSHFKYATNYDFNKAVMIVNHQSFADTGFVLLREEKSLTPPMAVINYEFYDSSSALENEFLTFKERIQCIAGHGYVPFGFTQKPNLWDYADDIDTINFLLKNFPAE